MKIEKQNIDGKKNTIDVSDKLVDITEAEAK